jgi:hypothetical protein
VKFNLQAVYHQNKIKNKAGLNEMRNRTSVFAHFVKKRAG